MAKAAEQGIGRDDAMRAGVDQTQKAILGILGGTAAAAVVGVIAAAATSPVWLPIAGTVVGTQGFNVEAAAGDDANQLVTKDPKDFNMASPIANGAFSNPLISAFAGSAADVSYNSLSGNRPIIKNLNSRNVWISVLSNATGNALSARLSPMYGDFLGNAMGSNVGTKLEDATINPKK